jgi:Methyltransferase FkbM domain
MTLPLKDVEVVTSFGRFYGPASDIIVSTLRANTLWDGQGFLQPLAREWARFGEVGTTILDVGAHIGTFTIWCASKGAWRVVSVEPMPETFRYLQASLDLNKETCQEVVIPLCVAGYGQQQALTAGPLDPGNWGGRTVLPQAGPIMGEPLDTYRFLFGQRVSLIKIDAQGCDGQVLRGLEKTIKRDHPVIIFEWDEGLAAPHGISLEDTKRFLSELGYTVHEWPTHGWNFLALPSNETT